MVLKGCVLCCDGVGFPDFAPHRKVSLLDECLVMVWVLLFELLDGFPRFFRREAMSLLRWDEALPGTGRLYGL
jgi:hypothetical protein